MTAPAASQARSARSSNADWLRALQAVAPIEKQPNRVLADAFDNLAAARPDAPALIDDHETLSFGELAARSNRYARWALTRRLNKGDVVGLLMENRADYVAIWLGLNRAGVVAALLNPSLTGDALAHCIAAANARAVIVSIRHQDALDAALAGKPAVGIFVRGGSDPARALDTASYSGAPLDLHERPAVKLSDHALYIYTSGTTGLPKAAIVSHRRVMHWAYWFSGLIDAKPSDRMYNCLPLYHSVGGVVAVWATLIGGGSVIVRERFSASRFWEEAASFECTLFQYIGELCRYLVNAPASAAQTRHRLRLAVGNGLREDVWRTFEQRFSIPRIIEFYAATESNFSLYNLDGEPGAIGRTPSFLAHRFQTRIVAFDVENERPLRSADGRCIICGPDETGEVIAKIEARGGDANFEGYVSKTESERKILRDVFEPGDAWMRSGDLMRKDARGFYFFVDRIGDTFRWKGENVSTFEVAQTVAACPGVLDANVYGVAVPGHDGRAGMAALSVESWFDRHALRAHVETQLPAYARPLFLRLRDGLEITETFKHKKAALARDGFDPRNIGESVFFAAPGSATYEPVDEALYARIISGVFRF